MTAFELPDFRFSPEIPLSLILPPTSTLTTTPYYLALPLTTARPMIQGERAQRSSYVPSTSYNDMHKFEHK
jgi:hypothetical protein